MTPSQPLRAPQGAVAWSPQDGWLYGPDTPSDALTRDGFLLVVTDGHVYGVKDTDRAPLAATIRQDAELADLRRWHAILAAKLTNLIKQVAALQDRAEGQSTGDAIEFVALKARVRRLEEDRG